jgi:hypothetical protein
MSLMTEGVTGCGARRTRSHSATLVPCPASSGLTTSKWHGATAVMPILSERCSTSSDSTNSLTNRDMGG